MAKIEINQGWGTMQLGIEKLKRILEGLPEPQFDSTKYMELYTTTYNMCTQKPPYDYSEELYDRYVNVFVTYLNSIVLPSLKSKHDEFMLRELMLRWANHKVMVRWLSRFFSYLDRYFCKKKNKPPLNDTGVICFRDNVFGDFKGQVGVEVLKIIEKEREGDKIDRGLLKNVIEIFVAVGIEKMDFYEGFEAVMLEESRAYYSRKASTWIVGDPCPAYMEKAENRLREEKERVVNYLHSSTHDKLIGIVQKELLVAYSVQLLESQTGVGALLKDNKKDDISRMFRLFNDIPDGLAIVVKSFKQHIINEGNSLIQQAEAAPADGSAAAAAAGDGFVRNLIDLHDKFTGYVTEAFRSSSAFHLAMKAAFEVICNKNVAGSTSAELLASYLDSILKKGGGSEKLSNEDIETALGKVVKVLDYVSEKDLFAEFHRKKLSRRLLFDKSIGEDYEKVVLQNLKVQLGGTFTAKMEGMVTDLALGRENQSQFAVFLNDYRTGIDLSVTVLTTGFWPTYKSSEINLPEEMAKSVQVYKDFYQLRAKSRKLTWIYSLGTCQVNAKFDQKMMELTVGVYQAAALLLFNHTDKLSYSEIRTQLNMGDEHLVRTLHSLSCGKYKVLIKEPNTKTVTAKDTFSYNSKFTDRMRRIKIPLPVVDDRKKVVEDVDKERRYAIDACIVRIMKSRKVLGHQLLVTECVEQLSKLFKPDFKVIKKRIESLISQEYLERDHDNPNQFRYLA